MNIDDIRGRMAALKARASVGDRTAYVIFIVSALGPKLSVDIGNTNIFDERGDDIEALFNRANLAIDERDPILLARTLGIEPAQAAEKVAAE